MSGCLASTLRTPIFNIRLAVNLWCWKKLIHWLRHLGTPQTQNWKALSQLGIPHQLIGGSLSPRTAEEATFEGLRVGVTL